jgi:hypothetical protein
LRQEEIRQRHGYNKSVTSNTVLEVHKKRPHLEEAITFSKKDWVGISQPYDDALVLRLKINTHQVRHILIDTESSVDVMYLDAFIKMGYTLLHLVKVNTPLVGFTSAAMVLEGLMCMRVEFKTPAMYYISHGRFFSSKDPHLPTMLYWVRKFYMNLEPLSPSLISK